MKKLVLASALAAAAAVPIYASAAEPESPHTVTGNMTIATDYRFRGLSQTFAEGFDFGPAIQGGIDYTHSSGLYFGNWNSNVSSNTFPNGSSIEMDFYGGFKFPVGEATIDIGTIYYYYPGSEFANMPTSSGGSKDYDAYNWEVYVGATYGPFAIKYYYSFSDYFGLSEDVLQGFVGCNPDNTCSALDRDGDTDGTQYLTVSYTTEIAPKLTLGASVGYTWVANYGDLDYFDYKLGLTYDYNGWMLGAALVGTDADDDYWYAVDGDGEVKDVGEPTIVLSVTKTF